MRVARACHHSAEVAYRISWQIALETQIHDHSTVGSPLVTVGTLRLIIARHRRHLLGLGLLARTVRIAELLEACRILKLGLYGRLSHTLDASTSCTGRTWVAIYI